MIRDLLGAAASAAASKIVEVAILDAPRKGDALARLEQGEPLASDLLNGPDKTCECGDCDCANPVIRDPDARPGRQVP